MYATREAGNEWGKKAATLRLYIASAAAAAAGHHCYTENGWRGAPARWNLFKKVNGTKMETGGIKMNGTVEANAACVCVYICLYLAKSHQKRTVVRRENRERRMSEEKINNESYAVRR